MKKITYFAGTLYCKRIQRMKNLRNIDCLFILAAFCRIAKPSFYIRNMKSMGRFGCEKDGESIDFR